MIDRPKSVPLDDDGTDAERPPVLPFLHRWAGPGGTSRLALSQMAGVAHRNVGGRASPQRLHPFPGEVAATTFAVLPVGRTGDRHESPKVQRAIPLRGRWFIETMDDARVETGPATSISGRTRGRPTRWGTARAGSATSRAAS